MSEKAKFTKGLAAQCLLCLSMYKTAKALGETEAAEVYRTVGETLSLAGLAVCDDSRDDWETTRDKVAKGAKALRDTEAQVTSDGAKSACLMLAEDIDALVAA